MITKKRKRIKIGGTAAERTAPKKSTKTAPKTAPKKSTKATKTKKVKSKFNINDLFNQLGNLKTAKNKIEEQEKEIKDMIKESGFNEHQIITTEGFHFIKAERNNFDVHKPGAIKALGTDTFIRYAKISASDIKKAVGETGFQDLIDRGTVKKKSPTVYYALKKK